MRINEKYLVDPDQTDFTGCISASQIMSFMSCKKKWAYNYIENLKPRLERPYLTIGKLCHTGMQHAMQHKFMNERCVGYCREDSMTCGILAMHGEFVSYIQENSFLDEELPGIDQTYEDAVSVFEQAWFEFNPDRWEVLQVKDKPALELHFKIPCAGSKGLHGYIDAILKDVKTGDIWCVDYKFRKSMSPDEEEAFNIQNAIYCQACNKIGVPITGTLTWQHSNTPTAIPAINKNGTMSRAKVKTTWDKYSEYLVKNGLNPEDYREEMEPKLADVEFYRATTEYRNNKTVKNMWSTIVVPNSFAIKAAHSPKAKNNPSMYPWNCKMCQYKDLCQAELRDYDVNFIKLSQFSTRLSRSAEEDKNIIDNNGQDVI
jgi:hypothetical protein